MSTQPKGKYTNINEISDRLDIPMPFLGKTLQLLVKGKLLSSLKGPKGGFKLEKNPGEITLFHVVDVVDGASFMTSCVLGFPECSSKNPCPVHFDWGHLRDRIYHMLAHKTILDFSRDITATKQLRSRLKPG